MSKPIQKLVDDLPNQQHNYFYAAIAGFCRPFGKMVGFKTRFAQFDRREPDLQIGERAIYSGNDRSGIPASDGSNKTVDSTDAAFGAAAFANKVGEKNWLFGFLNRIILLAMTKLKPLMPEIEQFVGLLSPT